MNSLGFHVTEMNVNVLMRLGGTSGSRFWCCFEACCSLLLVVHAHCLESCESMLFPSEVLRCRPAWELNIHGRLATALLDLDMVSSVRQE